MSDITERVLDLVEIFFVKYGAQAVDNGARNDELGLRSSFLRDGIYYRAESADFDGKSVIIITATDNASYAKIGIQDNIAGFPADISDDLIEKEVRYAFGIEEYPSNYPGY